MALQFLGIDVEYSKMCHQKEENAFVFAMLLVFISANREAMTLLPWLWKMISCFPVLFVCNRMYFKHLASQFVLMDLAHQLCSQVPGELETCNASMCLTFVTYFLPAFMSSEPGVVKDPLPGSLTACSLGFAYSAIVLLGAVVLCWCQVCRGPFLKSRSKN